MENMWNRQVKRLVFGLLVMFLSGFILCYVMQNIYRDYMRTENYRTFALFLGNVKEICPQLKEEEWIQILNGQKSYEEGRRMLEAYGILEGNKTFEKQEKEMRMFFLFSNLCMLTVGAASIITVILYMKERHRRIVDLTGYMFQVEEGNYGLAFETNREDDLSSLKNELYKITVLLKEQAENARRNKAALAESVSDISHQLKTPLTSVMVLVDNLSESGDMPENTRKQFLAEITRQLTGVNWLIAALLKLSKLDAGVVEFEQKPVPLDMLLKETMEDLEMMAEWKQIQLSLNREGKAVICGDVHWFKEAFTNIVKNAIEHSPENGRIEIWVRDNSVYSEITISDEGEGMTQEEQKHIFERFYQRKGKKELRGGRQQYGTFENTGIGLALAKEIIEKQKGYITVESQPDKGTCFSIKFMKNI